MNHFWKMYNIDFSSQYGQTEAKLAVLRGRYAQLEI